MENERLSLLMGERLKAERERKGLSHVALRDAILKEYGIEISKDSLINYEVADGHHTKAYKNNGMRVEYLRCLSDFFNVSSDWLLGISDIRSPDKGIQAVCDYTGLSEVAVEALKNPSVEWIPYGTETLNILLESPHFEQIVTDLSTYFWGFSVCVREGGEVSYKALSDVNEFKEFIQPAMIPRITEALSKIKEEKGRIYLWAKNEK